MDPRFDPEIVRDFLANVGHKQASKGYRLFASGAVRRVSADPARPWSYVATVEEGGESHHVTLEYDEEIAWVGECDCDRTADCRHSAALLYASRQLPAPAKPNVPAGRRSAGPVPPIIPKQKGIVLIPSPLSEAMEQALGRQLKPEEAAYVIEVRRLWEAAGQSAITKWHMANLVRLPGPSWDRVDLCPARPQDDLECWQYVARVIRLNNLPIPDFMEPVTDTGRVEESVMNWEREREVARWRGMVEQAGHVTREAAAVPMEVELRLRFGSESAEMEWRSGGGEPFRKCRRKDLDEFAGAFHGQSLSSPPETEKLLLLLLGSQGLMDPSLDYRNNARLLCRILRADSLEALTVGPSGRPLIRAREELRMECVQPDKADGHYLIRLAMPDGGAPGPFMAALQGAREWLYLTEDTVYRGPPHHGLGHEPQVLVPAAAMESPEGYRFFHSRGIPVPPRVAGKVQVVPMIPTAVCSVADRVGAKASREFRVKLTATAPGAPRAEFRRWQWTVTREGDAGKRPGDRIVMLDNELMHRVSGSLERLDVKWDENLGLMYRRWPKAYPEWVVNWIRSLPEGVDLQLDPELRSLLDDPVSARLRIEMQESEIDWFDVKVVMDVSDTTLSREELDLLLKAAGTPVFIPRLGSWKRMKTDWTDEDGRSLAKIGLSPADLSGEPHRVHVLQLADEAAAKLLPADHAEKIRRRLDELKTRVTPPAPRHIKAELRPYQLEGFHFLAYLAENRFGGVLADDMGLGKTLETLVWLAWLREQKAPPGNIPCSLVVCPKSVMENWRSEAERFFPALRVTLWAPALGMDYAAVRREADLVVMNYAQLRLLDPAALRSPWFVAVLDEAQGIKNPNSLTAQAARAVVATYRLALTGTPIENRLMDLWSIMAFAMPGALGNRSLFARRFASQEDPLARGRLAARVRPFLIRRTKEEVAKDLPERIEEDIVCEMEGTQLALYQAELKRAQQLLLGVKTQAEFNRERFSFLTSLLRLRQICCHAALVGRHAGVESAKMGALFDLVEPLMDEGHKVLVFSQFVQMLAMIEQEVEERKWPRFLLTGDTEDRGTLVRSFQEHPGCAVFLLSLKAGGFGLNLTAANYVVLYDPWWNPAVERQAIDRTHRIGQTNPVNAYRLIAKNSIEQKIRVLQKKKSALAEAVLGDERFGEALTLDDLKFILQD